MFSQTIETLLNKALQERSDLFLVELNTSPSNAIKVVIDGDNGVQVEDCMYISRAIEHNLDREAQDFSIEVLSFGATTPLQFARQYKKNMGRTLEVITLDNNTITGTITQANGNAVTLSWKTREPKPVGKGKVTVTKTESLNYEDIKQAKVKIIF